jgi:hypothetical protein
MIPTMSAPMAQSYGYSAPPNQNPAVIRGVGKCVVLLICSFGLWGFAWMYHTAKEVSAHVRQPPPAPGVRALLYIIPIVNLVMLFFAWQEIDDYCKRAGAQSFNVVLLFVLTIIIPFAALFTMPIVQSRMNDAHRAATNGAATDAKMETIDWVFVGIGIAFFALYVLIIIVAIAANA